MRNLLKVCVVSLAGALVFSSYGLAQTSPQTNRGGIDNLYDKLANSGSGGPAPRRDLTGFWAGQVAAKLNQVAPMTPWGEEQFRLHKNNSQFPVAESNDPIKGCDPLGFPRNMLFMGYSIGRWEGDYTFVVDTVGSDDRSWLDNAGHPHSIDLRVQERYTRVDHNTMEVTITINDPKTYTKPFVITKSSYKWIPRQDFEEQLCVASEEAEYLKLIGDPAAHGTPGK